MSNQFPVTLTLDHAQEYIEDILTTAIEEGYDWWGDAAHNADGSITIQVGDLIDLDHFAFKNVTITREQFLSALVTSAVADWLDNYDCLKADALLQRIVHGTVVYG